MVIRTRFRKVLALAAFHIAVLGASGFFAWNAYIGDRGLVARREHKVRIAQLNRKIDEIVIERSAFERRVQAFLREEIDRDLLDERSRVILNLAHKNDVIITISK